MGELASCNGQRGRPREAVCECLRSSDARMDTQNLGWPKRRQLWLSHRRQRDPEASSAVHSGFTALCLAGRGSQTSAVAGALRCAIATLAASSPGMHLCVLCHFTTPYAPSSPCLHTHMRRWSMNGYGLVTRQTAFPSLSLALRPRRSWPPATTLQGCAVVANPPSLGPQSSSRRRRLFLASRGSSMPVPIMPEKPPTPTSATSWPSSPLLLSLPGISAGRLATIGPPPSLA